MEAGALRHRIAIQENTSTENSRGEKVPGWTTYYQCWASVADLSGREFFEANQSQSQISTEIRMRYKSGITPQMRVVFGSRAFEIVSVANPMGRNKELVLLCTEMVQ